MIKTSPSSAASPAASPVALALLGATLVSAVAVLPAAARCSPSAHTAVAWIALWGLLACVAGPVAALVRTSKPWTRRIWAIPLGVLLALPCLTFFGRVLHRSTHHRPLGAATFAVLGGVLLLGCVVVTLRLLALTEAMPRVRRLATASLSVLVCAALAAELALLFSGARQAGTDHPLGFFVDGTMFLITVAAGAWLPVQILRVPRWVGPAAWLVIVGVSATWLAAVPNLRGTLVAHAPVLSAAAAQSLERQSLER